MKIDKYMQENPYPDIPEFESSEKPKTNKIIYILISVILLIVFVSVLFFIPAKESVCGNGICEVDENCFDCPDDCKCGKDKICSEEKKLCVKVEEKKEKCGDGICDSEENCYDCPKDCKCAEGEYCSAEEKRCVMPTCGDGRCEPYENSMNCCLDCECEIRGEVCNRVTHKCEMPDVGLTDKRIEELVVNYYNTQGKNVDDLEIQEVFVWENKVGRKVGVRIPDQEWLSFVLVTEDEEVIELPFF